MENDWEIYIVCAIYINYSQGQIASYQTQLLKGDVNFLWLLQEMCYIQYVPGTNAIHKKNKQIINIWVNWIWQWLWRVLYWFDP